VTPSEHLGLPFPEDVREGVIASRIAAHVGDMIKHKERLADKQMSKARRDMKWETQFSLAIDPERMGEIKRKRGDSDDHSCTMCGKFCANDILRGMFEADLKGTDKA
jgi:phosphomethylpyrimidine synthase